MRQQNIITFRGVDIYRQDDLILKQVNLQVKAGEFVYLIGKVGSGKSSLLKFINAEIPFENGEADILGYDFSALKESDVPYLRRRLGVVYQDLRLLMDRSVYDNLSFVLKATGWRGADEIEQRIDEVLRQVDMQEMKEKMPHELSGGEQQRVVVARAILNTPELLLADEPTGNLDPKASAELMDIFQSLHNQGITILMATHNYQLIESHKSRIIHIDNHSIFDPEAPKE